MHKRNGAAAQASLFEGPEENPPIRQAIDFYQHRHNWSVDGGANPILTLRCWWLDGRYDDFFKARARPPPMALAA